MNLVYIFIVALALLPQMLFSVLYWVWVPSWVKNPYGRLAQLDAWCRIILLSILFWSMIFGRYFNDTVIAGLYLFGFFLLIFFGLLQLYLLKKAVDSSKETERERVKNDS